MALWKIDGVGPMIQYVEADSLEFHGDGNIAVLKNRVQQGNGHVALFKLSPGVSITNVASEAERPNR